MKPEDRIWSFYDVDITDDERLVLFDVTFAAPSVGLVKLQRSSSISEVTTITDRIQDCRGTEMTWNEVFEVVFG